MKIIYYLTLGVALFISNSFAKTVNYTFNLSEESYNENGRVLKNIKINNENIGPILKAEMGDTLEIKVVNNTNIETTIHFHGVILPNNQDGVGGVTQEFIKPKQSFTYKFEVKQEGTYWYHAHGFEKAQGLYGGIVFGSDSKNEDLLLYSGKFNKDAATIFKGLKNGNMPSSCSLNMNKEQKETKHMSCNMKDSQKNHSSNKTAKNEAKNKMMHYSDVSYPKHMINSFYNTLELKERGNGKEVKLRIVNTYIDGFLNFVYSGGDIKVIASDGLPVKPFKVKNLKVAMGETYDIVLNTKSGKSYELVSFILGTKDYSKVIIGKGDFVKLPNYDYKSYSLKRPYEKIKTEVPKYLDFNNYNNNVVNYNFSLKGSHHSYNWEITDHEKKLEKLNLQVGDKVVVKLKNNTMMPHPMHLHGFFFKVVSSKNTLVKHTYNMEPSEEIEIEFIVDKEGKWLFHCHNLFHMASSMMVTFDVQKAKN